MNIVEDKFDKIRKSLLHISLSFIFLTIIIKFRSMLKIVKNGILLILLLSTNILFAQTLYKQKHSLNIALNALKYDKDLANAGIGFYVKDVNTGEVLSAYNQNLALTPASVQKLITTATAIEILGPNYKFKTKVEYVGSIDPQTGILTGKIIIKGGGDPTLGSKYFPSTSTHSFLSDWAKAIYDSGIKYVNGEIIGDSRIYGDEVISPTWTWEDIGNYFGAGVFGLSIYDNMYHIFFNTGSKVGGETKIVKVDPKIPGMSFDNHVKADAIRSDKSCIFGVPYTNERYINGRLPVNRKSYRIEGSIPDPPWYAAYELKKKLKGIGINSGAATTFRKNPELESIDSMNHKLLFETRSPDLKKIIKRINFRSINLGAEQLFKKAQLKSSGYDIEKIDKDFTENFWKLKGINIGGMFIYDGSGLSRYNTLTTKQVVSILSFMKTKSKYSQYFYESLPIVGKDGTFKYFCKGTSAENNMRIKSGLMKKVRSYSGYVTTKSGRKVAFSLIINNYNGTSTNVRKKMEKLLAAIADFNL